MRRLIVAGFVLIAVSGVASATRWADRCQAQLLKVKPALASIGKPTLMITSPPKTRPGETKAFDELGEVSFQIVAGDHTYTATIGSDHAGHRYRGELGMESPRYEVWHSPYEDTLNGDPPDLAVQPMLEEFHHRVYLGLLRAELRVDVDVPPAKRKKRPEPPARNQRAQFPSHLVPQYPVTYAGQEKLFADVVRPVLTACWTDILPDEADPIRQPMTKCLDDMTAAYDALVKLDPVFRNGTCARDRFEVSCGNVNGAEPTWNALPTLSGHKPDPSSVWADQDKLRHVRGDGEAMIWRSEKLASAKFDELKAGFEKPLERCLQLMRDNLWQQ